MVGQGKRKFARGDQAFRKYLEGELSRRIDHNPRYSLRAFAQQLDVDSSALSKLLSGKRNFSEQMVRKIGERLNLSTNQVLDYIFSGETSEEEPNYRQLSEDQFRLLSDWYHFGILQLLHTDGFKNDPQWIAKRLNITVAQVNLALARLLRMEFIKRDSSGKLIECAGSTTTGDPIDKVAAYKLLQKQLLTKAIEAVDNIPFAERDQSSMTVAVNRAQLPKYKKRIDQFRRSLTREIEKENKRDSVYAIVISLLPLTEVPLQ